MMFGLEMLRATLPIIAAWVAQRAVHDVFHLDRQSPTIHSLVQGAAFVAVYLIVYYLACYKRKSTPDERLP